MSLETVRGTVNRLVTSANALTIIGVAIDARLSGVPLDPQLAPHVDAALSALDLTLDDLSSNDLLGLRSQIRAYAHLNLKLLYPEGRAPGWRYDEGDFLQSWGRIAKNFVGLCASKIPGLTDRLNAEGATFLDVGTGVAQIAIQTAQLYPSMRVTGVDNWAPALALARQNVAEAGLEGRVELREQSAQDIDDEAAFDLAWIPTLFIPEPVVAKITERVLRALAPGGWLIVATVKEAPDPLLRAIGRFHVASFGGWVTSPQAIERVLRDKGYAEVRTMDDISPIGSFIAGRRPE
jgi:SAM-dependent methyltransferase